MTLTKAQRAEQEEARDTLRELLPPGSTVYTTVRHVSRSGMSRAIDVYVIEDDSPRWLSRLVARAGIGSWSERYEAVTMGGCGMDMGFALVYNLAQSLYPDGFGCIGEGCPSNDHSNGDRDYTVDRPTRKPILAPTHGFEPVEVWPTVHTHWHASGGYALNQRWL